MLANVCVSIEVPIQLGVLRVILANFLKQRHNSISRNLEHKGCCTILHFAHLPYGRRGGGERIYLSTRYITATATAISHRVAAQWPTRQLEKCTRRFRKGARQAISVCVPLLKAGKSYSLLLCRFKLEASLSNNYYLNPQIMGKSLCYH